MRTLSRAVVAVFVVVVEFTNISEARLGSNSPARGFGMNRTSEENMPNDSKIVVSAETQASSEFLEGRFSPEGFLRGGKARGTEFWSNSSFLQPAASISIISTEGYQYLATTTRYADTCCSSCGSVNTASLVEGTGYHAVASAEAMQNAFPGGSCCWCGAAGSNCGHNTGTAPMGCSKCARGRFIRKLPYNGPIWGGDSIFQREFKIVVADICPHQGNEVWCPASGSTNNFGSKNHFDWASPPAEFDNYYFAFTPEPCNAIIEQRFSSQSKCNL